jgi:hypothetical protein
MITAGLNQSVRKQRDHLGKVNPNRKIKIPAHSSELFGGVTRAVVLKAEVGLEINVV